MTMRFIGKFARQKWGFEPIRPLIKGFEDSKKAFDIAYNVDIDRYLQGYDPYFSQLIRDAKIRERNPSLYENLVKLKSHLIMIPNTIIPVSLLKKIKSATPEELQMLAMDVKTAPVNELVLPRIKTNNERAREIVEKNPFLEQSGFDAIAPTLGDTKFYVKDKIDSDDELEVSLHPKKDRIIKGHGRNRFEAVFKVNDEYDMGDANVKSPYKVAKSLKSIMGKLRRELEKGESKEDVSVYATPYVDDGGEQYRIQMFDKLLGLQRHPSTTFFLNDKIDEDVFIRKFPRKKT